MKKRVLLMMLLVCLCVLPCISASANDLDSYRVTSDEEMQEVIRKATGVKSGSYTYYIDRTDPKSPLMRAKDGKTAQKIADKARTFFLAEKKVFFCKNWNNSKIYVMNRDGSSCRLLADHVDGILGIKDGYMYYVSAAGNCVRVNIDTGVKERIVKGNGSYSFLIYNDRLYFAANKQADNNIETEYSVVKSIGLDGKNVKVELAKAKGHYTILVNDGDLLVCNNRMNVEESYDAYNWYKLGADGQWGEFVTEIPIGIYIFNYNDGRIYFYTGSEELAEDDEALGKAADPAGLGCNVIYTVDSDGKLNICVDLKKTRAAYAEYFSVYSVGDYFCVNSSFDQSLDGIYIYKDNKLVRDIDLGFLGEEGSYSYEIVDDCMYMYADNYIGATHEQYFYVIGLK